MRALPREPQAADVTEEIAARCHYDFEFGHYHLPEYKLPEGETDSFAYLTRLCREGYVRRYGETGYERDESAAAQYELDMIHRMGFVDYFLIVWDFVHYAKPRHPRRPRRAQRRGQHGLLYARHHGRRPDPVLALLRAVLEPRAREHARYRYGLLRAPPRRGHRLRYAQIRRGPRRADRHLRHDGRAHGHPRRRPRAESQLRGNGRRRQAGAERPGRAQHDARRSASSSPSL